MKDIDLTKRPKEGAGDVAHKSVKLVLTSLPVLGSTAAELFSTVIVPPIEKRRDRWVEEVAKGLRKLEERVDGFEVENLKDNETFITVVLHASQVAIRNNQKEKLDALRNAVLNSTSRNAPDEDLQLMFLDFVDTLTPWHLRVLKFFENPKLYCEKHGIKHPDWQMGSPSVALHAAFPELKDQREFEDLIVRDLFTRGLFSIESLYVTMTGRGMFESRTSSMGNQFIRYITSPIE